MKFEQKKRNQIEFDELNIKSHLNTSLEADGISVSEDLINRTLDAIRMEKTKNVDFSNKEVKEKKSNPLLGYTRILITVAAAVIVLVLGINRLFAPLGKKMDKMSADNAEYKSFEISDASMDELQVPNRVPTSAGGYLASEIDDLKTAKSELDNSIGESLDIDEEQKEAGDIYGASDKMVSLGVINEIPFTDITLINPLDVKSITISSYTSGQSKTITEVAQLDRFYSVMENHYFWHGTSEDDVNKYIVKIIGEDTDSQMIISTSSVRVDYTNNDISSQSIYLAVNQGQLLEDIEKLLAE